jgi:hypothetical protein
VEADQDLAKVDVLRTRLGEVGRSRLGHKVEFSSDCPGGRFSLGAVPLDYIIKMQEVWPSSPVRGA